MVHLVLFLEHFSARSKIKKFLNALIYGGSLSVWREIDKNSLSATRNLIMKYIHKLFIRPLYITNQISSIRCKIKINLNEKFNDLYYVERKKEIEGNACGFNWSNSFRFYEKDFILKKYFPLKSKKLDQLKTQEMVSLFVALKGCYLLSFMFLCN